MADLKSTNGTIHFDVNNDQVSELTLNQTGLGVGINSPSSNLHVAGNTIIHTTVSIGSNASSSNLHVTGSQGFNFQTVSSNIELDAYSTYFVDSSNGNLQLTLPYAGNVEGRILTIKKISSENQVVIRNIARDGDHAYIMDDNSATGALPSLKLISSNNFWYKLSEMSLEPAWTPSSANAITFWVDLSDASTVTTVNGNVSQIDDLSGNDFHMTQGTPTNQPTYDENKMVFDNDSMSSASFSTAMSNISEYRVFVVAREDERRTNNAFRFSPLSGASSSIINSHLPWSNGVVYFDLGANSGVNRLNASIGVSVGELFMVQYVNSVTAGEHALRITGDEKSSNGTTFTYDVGASPKISLGNGNVKTTFYEIILAGSYLSPTEAEKIEGYLAWKWDLVENLPDDHSFKTAPPF